MAIDTRPPEGAKLTQEQWEIFVEQTDGLLNARMRRENPKISPLDPTVCITDIFRVVKDENGVSSLKPMFEEGMTPDKYEQARRLFEASRNKERILYRPYRSSTAIELMFQGEPPQPITSPLIPKVPEAPLKPDETFVPKDMPDKPKLPEAPFFFGLEELLYKWFGWFAEEVRSYNKEVEDATEKYVEEMDLYDRELASAKDQNIRNLKKFNEDKVKYPSRLEEYNRQKAEYDRALAESREVRNLLAPYNKQFEAHKKADRKGELSQTRDGINSLISEVSTQRRIERSFKNMLGAKPNVDPQVLRNAESAIRREAVDIPENNGMPIEPPEYLIPEEMDELFQALTLGVCAHKDVMKGITDSSTQFVAKGTEEDVREINRYNAIGVKLFDNTLMGDGRCDMHLVGVQRARAQANTAFEQLMEGDAKQAAEHLAEGLSYYTRLQRAKGASENSESISSVYGIKLLVNCLDKYPQLAQSVDKELLQEARGYVRVYDELKLSREAHVKLLTDTPKDPQEREALLLDAMVGAAMAETLKAQKREVCQRDKEFVYADKHVVQEPARYIRAICGLESTALSMVLGDPKMANDLRDGMAKTLRETQYFKDMLALPPEELVNAMATKTNNNASITLEIMENSRKAIIAHGQQKHAVQEPEREKQKTQQVARTSEVKVQEEKPPIPKQPIV